MITGLPRDVTEKEVRHTLENYPLKKGRSGSGKRVYRVNFAYYIGDFIKIAREKNEAVKILFKEKRKPFQDKILIHQQEKKIKKLDKNLSLLKGQYSELKNRKNELFTGICFVTFNDMLDKVAMKEA